MLTLFKWIIRSDTFGFDSWQLCTCVLLVKLCTRGLSVKCSLQDGLRFGLTLPLQDTDRDFSVMFSFIFCCNRSTFISIWGPAAVKHSHSIMFPVPCFMVKMVYFWLLAVLHLTVPVFLGKPCCPDCKWLGRNDCRIPVFLWMSIFFVN